MTCQAAAASLADAEIHVGALAPYALRYTVTSDDPVNFDLSSATAGEFSIKRGDGDVDTWTASIENQSAESLDLVHVFTTGDVPDIDVIKILPLITVPGGTLVAEAKGLSVFDPFA